MKEANKSITDSINSGQYFLDAQSWYLFKFVNPLVDRTFVIVFMLFFIISTLIALYFYDSMSSVNSQVEYVAKTNDINKYYTVIKPLNINKEGPQAALEIYLCELYLTKRESYHYSDISKYMKYIQTNSSPAVYNKYEKYISINNPDSPQLIYQEYIDRDIKITSVAKNSREKNSFIIKFDAIISSQKSDNKETTKWIAKITYKVPEIKNLMLENAKSVDFKVVDYVVQKIN